MSTVLALVIISAILSASEMHLKFGELLRMNCFVNLGVSLQQHPVCLKNKLLWLPWMGLRSCKLNLGNQCDCERTVRGLLILILQGRSKDFFRGTHNFPNHFAPRTTPLPPQKTSLIKDLVML